MNATLAACFVLLLAAFSAAPVNACDKLLAATIETGPGPFRPPQNEFTDALADLTQGGKAQGELLIVSGQVLSNNGTPIPDAVIYIWQTDASGNYLQQLLMQEQLMGMGIVRARDPYFAYKGLTGTNGSGEYAFVTVEPVCYPGRCAHVHMTIMVAGKVALNTELHFSQDPMAPGDFNTNATNLRTAESVNLEFPNATARPASAVRFDIVLK